MKTTTTLHPAYSRAQLSLLVMLRVIIGWHILYEGVVKMWNPNWSASGYLLDSKGIFAGLFHAMAENATVLQIVDFVNVWGLVLVGLGLMLGLGTRWATIGGIVLIGLYFLSHPPFIGVKYALPSEGSYLFVNKNLIEVFALAVLLVFPTGNHIGLDRLISLWRNKSVPEEQALTEIEERVPVA